MSSSTSSELAISCKGVGKAFQLYLKRNDQLYQALFGRWKQFYHPHWVMRDVSFDVRRGELVDAVVVESIGVDLVAEPVGLVPATELASLAGRR